MTLEQFQAAVERNVILLKKTNDKNGVFDEEYNYVVDLYHKCQAENDFLK